MLQLFLITQDDVGVIHVSSVILDTPDILNQMVNAVRKSDSGYLTILRADVQSFVACCFHKRTAHGIEAIVLEMLIIHTKHMVMRDVVEKFAKVNNQNVPVIVSPFSPKFMQMILAPFDVKGNAFTFEACAVIVNQVVG